MRPMGNSICATLLLGFALLAQQPPPTQPTPTPTPTPAPGSGSGGGNVPTRPTQPTQPTQPRQPTQPSLEDDPFSQKRGITGRIVPNPGTRLRIELYLDGMRLDDTYTDLDGKFKFERVTTGSRRYEVHVEVGPGKEYVEEVDFSFEATIYIREQGIRDTAFSNSPGKGRGTMISLASLQVPKDAAKEFQKAHQARDKKKFDEALTRLQKATEIYPKYAEAFNEMGLVYRSQNHPAEAQQAFEKAIVADPAWVASYLNLAQAQLANNQTAQLLETSNRILQLDPTIGAGHFFHAVANFSQGNLEEAEKSALEADRRDHKTVPQVHLVLARIYQQQQRIPEYLKHLRAYLKEAPDSPLAPKLRAEIEKAEKPVTSDK